MKKVTDDSNKKDSLYSIPSEKSIKKCSILNITKNKKSCI